MYIFRPNLPIYVRSHLIEYIKKPSFLSRTNLLGTVMLWSFVPETPFTMYVSGVQTFSKKSQLSENSSKLLKLKRSRLSYHMCRRYKSVLKTW